MKTYIFAASLLLCAASLTAQTPATATASQTTTASSTRVAQTHTSPLGYSYTLPLDWEVVDTKPMAPVVHQKLEDSASSTEEKKGAECVQIDLLARSGNPPSIIEVVALPYDCFGQKFADDDLPGFASGITSGIAKSFTLKEPVYGAYKLGPHNVWIMRSSGSLIAHPEFTRTLEASCTLLKKGAVCWVSLAADEAALQTFERGSVVLEGDTYEALVPANALQKKP
jgi:hypothetical protein